MLDTTNNEQKKDNNSMEIYIVIAIALVIIVGGTYFYNTSKKTVVKQLPVVQPMPVIEPTQEPEPEPIASEEELVAPVLPPEAELVPSPTPELEPAIELPVLDKSDELALATAKQLSWLPTYPALLSTKDIIRNFVTFIDNLSRGELASKYSPLLKPTNKFTVIEVDDEIYLNEESYHRYDLYVDIINSINVEFALAQYDALRPLFNEAYQSLGYPDDNFESTLYRAIETALNAPIIREPIKLVAPSAMYKFADPELEQLPSAQKLMIRMGPDNMVKLSEKLQQIQLALERTLKE